MKSKKLQKIVTRFFHPIALEAWFLGATKELEKVIGIGFSDVIAKFDGEKIEIFRIEKELNHEIKKAMLDYIQTDKFINGISKYKELISEYDKLLSTDTPVKIVIKHFTKLYPLFAISYFVSNLWSSELSPENKDKIINLCKEYRILSEGILNKLDSFIQYHLKKQKLSLFSTLETLSNHSIKNDWLSRGFIFSKGKFYSMEWNGFLEKNEFHYNGEIALKKWKKLCSRGNHPVLLLEIAAGGALDFSKLGMDFKFNNFKFYRGETFFLESEWEDLNKKFREQIKKDKSFFKTLIEKCHCSGRRFIEFAKNTKEIDLKEKSTEELKKIFLDFFNIYSEFAAFFYFPMFLEKIFEKEIKEKLRKLIPEEKIDEYFSCLTKSPKHSYSNEEKIELLKIALEIRKKGWNDESIKKHSEQYSWIRQYLFNYRPYTIDVVKERLNEIMKDDVDKKLKSLLNKIENDNRIFNEIIKELDIHDKFLDLIKLAREYINSRDSRLKDLAIGHYNIIPLIDEFAKRLGLKYNEFIQLTIDEIKENKKDIEEIRQRQKENAVLIKDGEKYFYYGDSLEKSKNILEVKEDINISNEIKGDVACKGIVKGNVRIVKSTYGLKDFNKGEILVAPMTQPDFTFAMEKAAAIITDEGGITSHAAIIARELNKPCITGTKIATKVLKDGDLVEVDADKGIVRKL